MVYLFGLNDCKGRKYVQYLKEKFRKSDEMEQKYAVMIYLLFLNAHFLSILDVGMNVIDDFIVYTIFHVIIYSKRIYKKSITHASPAPIAVIKHR